MNPHIKQFQSYGLKLIPLHEDTKKPQTKNGKWKGVSWSEDEINSAKRLGSKILTPAARNFNHW